MRPAGPRAAVVSNGVEAGLRRFRQNVKVMDEANNFIDEYQLKVQYFSNFIDDFMLFRFCVRFEY